jgi:hypothetical protein
MSLTRRTALVFLCTVAYLGLMAASRFVFVLNDEGIYLDGGLRVFHGQMPYKDFFTLTGPGTFALEALSFRAFGATILAARIPVVWDIAIITACLFWLVSKLSDSMTASVTAFVYLTFATLAETAVVVNHRWDSSAWIILAGTLIIAVAENPASRVSRTISFVGGIAAGIAAWCTPPVALAIIALGACLIAYRTMRHLFVAYAGGVALAFTAGAFWIVSRGALPAMLNSFLSSASNYTVANRTWYGWVTGGYPNLLHGMSTGDGVTAIVFLAFFTLPATLPFLSAIWLFKRPPMSVVILLALGAALIVSTYPRWDLNHLTWVAAPFYALSAALIARATFPKAAALRKGVALFVLIAAGASLTVNVSQRLREVSRVTNLGSVHGKKQDLDMLATLQSRVKPSDTLFVFPYRPLLYFVTGAQNPTRYSFMQPGMFSEKDESEALNELRAHPPGLVLYSYLPPEAYLLIWPGSNPRRLEMTGIESFLRENYGEKERWAELKLLTAAH